MIGIYFRNEHYPSYETYLHTVADTVAGEYRAVIAAGFDLPIDCPDLAFGRHTKVSDLSLAEGARLASRQFWP
ncbi:MAG: hypothetical protein QF926_06890 [Alphaproteobacteria bacterium]|jgi:hypothetical protein|nr:hypothetical protein [Alphaproteobacteria bacterium]|tara:strand:- start:575 stop:793 length:219 start_codon:yes stop_codon:yes gene_type:complete